MNVLSYNDRIELSKNRVEYIYKSGNIFNNNIGYLLNVWNNNSATKMETISYIDLYNGTIKGINISSNDDFSLDQCILQIDQNDLRFKSFFIKFDLVLNLYSLYRILTVGQISKQIYGLDNSGELLVSSKDIDYLTMSFDNTFTVSKPSTSTDLLEKSIFFDTKSKNFFSAKSSLIKEEGILSPNFISTYGFHVDASISPYIEITYSFNHFIDAIIRKFSDRYEKFSGDPISFTTNNYAFAEVFTNFGISKMTSGLGKDFSSYPLFRYTLRLGIIK